MKHTFSLNICNIGSFWPWQLPLPKNRQGTRRKWLTNSRIRLKVSRLAWRFRLGGGETWVQPRGAWFSMFCISIFWHRATSFKPKNHETSKKKHGMSGIFGILNYQWNGGRYTSFIQFHWSNGIVSWTNFPISIGRSKKNLVEILLVFFRQISSNFTPTPLWFKNDSEEWNLSLFWCSWLSFNQII